jgi:hypothetical protein
MKTWKVTYRHGHFIDQETNLRIFPVQGAELVIVAGSDAFTNIDPTVEYKKLMSAEEKYNWAENEKGKNNFVKIMSSSDQLFFKILIPKKVKGDESRRYTFSCRLLEDQYLFLINGKNGNDKNSWSLMDCQCEIIRCTDGGLKLDGPLVASSLNNLFTKLVADYFRSQHSGASAAFYKFYLNKYPGINESLHGGSPFQEIKLDELRIRVARDYKPERDV